jgi:hypothetical protein
MHNSLGTGFSGSVELCYTPEGLGFKNRLINLILSMYLILLVALGLGVYSASNRK